MSTPLTASDARAPRPRVVHNLRGPVLLAFALFVAVLVADIAVIVRVAPFIDSSCLIYTGP
ncbi:MAG TPA: hypothetical protein VF502_15610 [Stellaceae bacterium]